MRRLIALLAGLLATACAPTGQLAPATPHSSRALRHRPVPAPVPVLPLGQVIGAGAYPTLASAVRAAGLGPLLAGAGPVTLFAPDEAAWARLAPGVHEALLRPENRGSLTALLRLHTVAGRVTAADLRRRAAAGPVSLPTLAGEPITVSLADGTLVLSDATGHHAYVVAPDGPATNGLVHEVNGLLVPQALGPQP